MVTNKLSKILGVINRLKYVFPKQILINLYKSLDPGMSLNCAPTRVCRNRASRSGYVVIERPDPGMS